jgi:hypothetical protein
MQRWIIVQHTKLCCWQHVQSTDGNKLQQHRNTEEGEQEYTENFPVSVHCLNIFLIFCSNHPMLWRVTCIKLSESFSAKKSTAIGVPSEKLWPFYYRTSESAGIFERKWSRLDNRFVSYPPFSICSLVLSFPLLFSFSFPFFFLSFFVTEGEKQGSSVDSVCGLIKRKIVMTR